MSGLFSPTQLAHKRKALDLFFSPEGRALRSDPELSEYGELALLDHAFSGWKHLQDKGIDGRTGKPISKLALGLDTPIEMDKAELLQAQINEVKNALSGVEEVEGFRQLDPADREYVAGLIRKHIAGADIGTIGGLGTNQRRYPKDYHDPELAGTVIPVNWEPGQKQERGVKLLLDKVEMVDPDTGVALHGVDIDAMHRQPAAERPDLVADIGNIKMGPTAMNQSDGKRVGEALKQSRQTRKLNLDDQLFYVENGVPAKWQGGLDKQTRDEIRYQSKLEKELDKELSEVREMSLEQIKAQKYKDDYTDTVKDVLSEEGPGDNRGKSIIIKADTVNLGEAKVNGNGKH